MEAINDHSYGALGKWIVEIMGKKYGLGFTILTDKFSGAMICILSSTEL